MHTGKFKTERSKFTRNMLPKFENIDTPVFDSMMRGMFRLTGFIPDTERHFFELLGMELYRHENGQESNIVLFGDIATANNIVSIMRRVTQQRGQIIQNTPESMMYKKSANTEKQVIPVDHHNGSIFDTENVIESELAGVFYKTVCGLVRTIERGKFETPVQFEVAHESFFRNVDAICNFIDEKLIFIDGTVTSLNDIFMSFLKFTSSGTRIRRKYIMEHLKSMGATFRLCGPGNDIDCIGVALKK